MTAKATGPAAPGIVSWRDGYAAKAIPFGRTVGSRARFPQTEKETERVFRQLPLRTVRVAERAPEESKLRV